MITDPSLLALLAGPIAISIASRDAGLRPSVVHAYGCRVIGEGAQLRLFVLRDEARQLLADIAANGEVATVYSDVRSFRSLQIKGRDATIETFDAADSAAHLTHHRITAEELAALGYAAPLAHGYFSAPRKADLVTVVFTPHDIFQQTPGPGAGDRLSGAKDLNGGRT
jgi:hypothetical protein